MGKPFNDHVPPQMSVFKELGDEGLHGDVIITSIKAPEDFNQMTLLPDGILALGEATLHMHKLFGDEKDFSLRECPKTKIKHLKVVNPVCLKHQEHNPVILPPGDYRIGIQREYDPFTKRIRNVQD